MRRAQPKAAAAGATKTTAAQTKKPAKGKAVDPNDPNNDADEGVAGPEDDEAIAEFFKEVKEDTKVNQILGKVSGYQGLDVIRVGPDFVDEEYYECTPVPLWLKAQPILNYDTFLSKTEDEIISITPIKPQTFSALFQFYRDRTPALNWDPNLTDLEEDCFYQDLIHLPSKKYTHSLPKESKKEDVPKKRVKDFKPNGDYVIKTRLTIDLTETPTVLLFEIRGILVLESDPKIEEVKVRNVRYEEIVKDHEVSDTYANDYAQTWEEYSLSKYTDYKINGCRDSGTQVHTHIIFDEYIRVAEEDEKRRIMEQDEATAKALAEKARLEIPQDRWESSESEDSDEEVNDTILDFRTDISKYKDDEEDNHREMILEYASDDDVAMSDDDEDEFEIRLSLDILYRNKKLFQDKKPPRIYPDISFSLIAMERIICMDSQQMRQADMRGLLQMEEKNPDDKDKEEDEDETKAEELDEDAMVSLLIQQHRLQEQLNDGVIEEGVATVVALDGGDGVAGDDDDDELMQELRAQEEAERQRLAKIKAEQDAKEKAEAAAAALKFQRENEKDEFDEAMDDMKVAAKPGDNFLEIIYPPGYSAEPLQAEHISGIPEGPPSAADTIPPDSFSKHTPNVTESRTQPELKTLVPPSASRPATGASSVTPSEMVGGPEVEAAEFGMGKGLNCHWTGTDERIDEEQVLEGENEIKEVIDDIPLNLPQYSPEEVMSDDETQAHNLTSIKAGKTGKELANDIGLLATGPYSEKHRLSFRPSIEEEDPLKNMKPPDAIEYDDISSDETHHENSELSDHVELTEDCSTDSEASGRRTTMFGLAAQRRKTEAARNLYLEWGVTKDAMDNDIGPISPGPHLRQYWNFKCKETAGLEVTEIKLHPLNENIIAAAYGSVRFGDHQKEGLICIWNAKNNRSPERIYKLKAPGTCLAFAELTPFLLAVGMLDGNVVLLDLREDDVLILGSTFEQKTQYSHVGPVWQIHFLITTDPSNEDVVEESLLTLGDDGLLKKWTITKGVESVVIMKVGRSTLQIPGRREKRSESLITTLSIAYTIAFFPTNPDLFLLGTEEGFIHKCSTAYKESYVSTYVGHTGPVYRVAFSNFDETVFYSCGGDWTVKMWKLDYPMPLLSLQTGHRTIFDVTCSMFSSTVFICATEYHIEVWDLSVNTLEPIVHYKPAFALGQRKLTFNGLLNSVIIGDDEGGLTIYGLRNFATPASTREAQKEVLLESLLPGYKRKKEMEEAERTRKMEMERYSAGRKSDQAQGPA